MAFTQHNQIDPQLRQTFSSPPKQSSGQFDHQNGPRGPFSPLQPSPNPSYQSIQTPNYFSNQQTQDSPEGESPGENPNDPNDLKRPRACEACRQLKVKCEPDDNSPTGSCKRCAKAGRQCVVTAPSRKRQKKTDSRVAELEKKIDALTATLAARGGSETDYNVDPNLQPQRGGSVYGDHYENATPAPHQSPHQIHDRKRKLTGDHDYFGGDLQKSAVGWRPQPPVPQFPGIFSGDSKMRNDGVVTPQPVDVIEGGIIDTKTAYRCFDRYVAEMSEQLPIVVFPQGSKPEDVRKSRPMLFLAVVAVASGTIRPDLQGKLISHATRLLADKIVYRGQKSLELVQTIQVMTVFYSPPEKYEELNFNQLIHIAAVMALDIGMGKRSKAPSYTMFRPSMETKKPLPDPDAPETRRCWLGCYYMCSNSAMSLRRPLLVRWNAYADQSLDILTTNPDALPSDKKLCQLVRAQHITETVGQEFSMDDPASKISLGDQNTQRHLKALERQLAEWREQVGPLLKTNPVFQHTEAIINLYMHEIAMHHEHNIDDFKPPYTNTPIDGPTDPDTITPAHFESLSTCLHSVHSAFEAFCSMDVKTLRALPTLFFVRNSYAAVALIKMYTAVAARGSKFGYILQAQDLKVDHYLDRVINTLQEVAKDGLCKVAEKFTLITTMLKHWHTKRTEPGPVNGNASRDSSMPRFPPPPHYRNVQDQSSHTGHTWSSRSTMDSNNQNTPSSSNPRTPLQMLSEAASIPGPPPQHHNNPSHNPPQWNIAPNLPPPQQLLPGIADMAGLGQPDAGMLAAYNAGAGSMSRLGDPGAPGGNGLGDMTGMLGPDGQQFSNDELMMAYGFGDEFMALNFGMEQGGWAF